MSRLGRRQFLPRSILALSAGLLLSTARAADWWQAQPTSMPVRPAAGEEVLQNPPVLSWPWREGARGYELRLQSAAGDQRWIAGRNVFLPEAALVPGRYRWSVRPLGSAGAAPGDWSDPREFVVGAAAQPFVVPSSDASWSRASAAAHPRGLPSGAERDEILRQARGAREAEFKALRAKYRPLIGAPLMAEPTDRIDRSTLDAAKVARIGSIRNELSYEDQRIRNLGWLWMIDADPAWRDEAVRRVMNLAAWDPRGSTGLVQHNQATRTVMLALATGYDWFRDQLSAPQREQVLQAIRVRGDDLFEFIVRSGTLQRNPFDSWGSYTLSFLVTAAPLVAGDLPEAQKWWLEGMPLYAAIFPAWSGDDGGYANGSNYGLLDVPESVVFWDLLRWSTGIDFMAKPAVRGYQNQLAHFLPPGSPVGQFGDGAEQRLNEWGPRYGKSYATRVDSPLMQWYAGQMQGEDRTTFRIVSAPASRPAARLPAGQAQHLWLRSIGWVAMHSDLEDRQRTSVYFKSSPFGSLNHSHADQNSFVIHARGQVLAADSGLYDYYGSPHYLGWYKQTKAHNAITFDGGQGQQTGANGLGSKAFAGRVESVDSGPGWVRTRGEAGPAYGSDVVQATRTLVYLRPDVVVVHDVLRAASPKRWEYNLHALAPWSPQGSGWRSASGGGVGLCVDVRADVPLVFEQSGAMQPPPASGKPDPDWRGVWALRAPAERAEFVSVLRVGCAAAEISAADAGVQAFALRTQDLAVKWRDKGLVIEP